MTYKEAIDYILSVEWLGSRPGKSRIRELCARLGNPQNKLKYVHVAGTNGKGSVCCMMANVLKAAGYKTGLYISPYVYRFNERIQLNGEEIPDDELAKTVEKVKEQADQLEERATVFELITATAFLWFAEQKCDVVVLEVGMGGRLDATNIIEDPLVSIITSIDLDHTEYLGDTLGKIAFEKAGIIKPGRPTVVGDLPKEALDVIEETAKERNSAFYQAQTERIRIQSESLEGTTFTLNRVKYQVRLPGTYQPKNASVVIRACELLSLPREAVKQGLAAAYWPARFEVLCKNPVVIYDGGHNPQGVGAAVDTVKRLGLGKPVILTGVMRDKDHEQIVGMLSSIASEIFTVKPNNPRALPAEEYAAEFPAATPCESEEQAVARAMAAAYEKNIPLLCIGSLYMYKEIRDAVTVQAANYEKKAEG